MPTHPKKQLPKFGDQTEPYEYQSYSFDNDGKILVVVMNGKVYTDPQEIREIMGADNIKDLKQ